MVTKAFESPCVPSISAKIDLQQSIYPQVTQFMEKFTLTIFNIPNISNKKFSQKFLFSILKVKVSNMSHEVNSYIELIKNKKCKSSAKVLKEDIILIDVLCNNVNKVQMKLLFLLTKMSAKAEKFQEKEESNCKLELAEEVFTLYKEILENSNIYLSLLTELEKMLEKGINCNILEECQILEINIENILC